MMKKERMLAMGVKIEHDSLWELIKLILMREKEIHGPTMVQGRDGGSECLKKQMSVSKLIRTPTPEDVVKEYAKFYTFKKGRKPGTLTPLKKQESLEDNALKKQESLEEKSVVINGNGAVPSPGDGKLPKLEVGEKVLEASKKVLEETAPQDDKKKSTVRSNGVSENDAKVNHGSAKVANTTNGVENEEKPDAQAIKMEDLKDPSSFGEMVTKVAKKIAEEKKKEKQKKKEEKKKLEKGGDIDEDKTKVDKNVDQIHLEKGATNNKDDGVKNGNQSKQDTTVKGEEVKTDPTKGDSEKEWSPTPTAAPRRRNPSFRKKKLSGGEKPPRPDGPSPPPPREEQETTMKVVEGTANIEPAENLLEEPAKQGIKEETVERVNGHATENKSVQNGLSIVDKVLRQKNQVDVGIGVDMVDAWTQTDLPIVVKNAESQVCCCNCHKT